MNLFLGVCLFFAGICIGVAVCAILKMAKDQDEEKWEPYYYHQPPEIEIGEED